MSTEEPKAIEKMEAYTPEWSRLANRIARDYCPPIRPCKHCGYPVIEGYCCHRCKSGDP